MNKTLVYNPVWMPTEEMIFLWSCEVPEGIRVDTLEKLELYLSDHYKRLSKVAFQEHGEKIFQWYHDFIDENYWYNDHTTLIDCLLVSDKYYYQKNLLEERVSINEMPEDIIASTEAQAIYEGVNLYDLLYMYHVTYF